MNGWRLEVDSEHVIVIGKLHCLIESRSSTGEYHSVEVDHGKVTCTCPGFQYRKRCRHSRAIRNWLMGKADVEVSVAA